MTREEELLERIHILEAENSELRDKLDLIYSIVAPEDETPAPDGLVQIKGGK